MYNAGAEIGAGFLLIVMLATQRRAILLTFLHWNWLRMRFCSPDAAAYHSMVGTHPGQLRPGLYVVTLCSVYVCKGQCSFFDISHRDTRAGHTTSSTPVSTLLSHMVIADYMMLFLYVNAIRHVCVATSLLLLNCTSCRLHVAIQRCACKLMLPACRFGASLTKKSVHTSGRCLC